MGKSRKTNVMRSIKETANKTLPVVDKGLTTVGTTAKDVAKASIPVIEQGVSAVYGTMATGLDLGVKGVKNVAKGISKSKSRRQKRTRRMSGGRRTRKHKSHHRKH